jgi:hypothetical protein
MSNSNESNDKIAVKDNILKLTNELLLICHNEQNNTITSNCSLKLSQIVPKQINSISQLNSNIFVFIYENVCNTELIGKI